MANQKAELTLFALAFAFAVLTFGQWLHALWIFIRLRAVKPSRPRLLMMLSSLALLAGHLFAGVTALLSLAMDIEAKGLTKQSSAVMTTFTIFWQGLAAVLVFLAVKHATNECSHGASSHFIFSGSRRAMKYVNETLVLLWVLVIVAHSVTLPFINDPLFSKSQEDLAHIISLDCVTDTFGWAFSALSVLAIVSMVYSCLSLRKQLVDAPEGLNRKAIDILTTGLTPLLVAEAILIIVTVALSQTLKDIIALAVAYFIIRGIIDLAVISVLIVVILALQGPQRAHMKLESAVDVPLTQHA
ncbi:hypothetical protein EXIGLDRAFT_519860 [Exidia glandulosa HHB12029]|uniref:Uncharacterized protein n=1 Tax=Exidia glandulosa HHB12029 TaxID=1314781 RepID=A0A165J500_EXIGL|nr:hypothetical protein EXIGLDRAFT_519860 [Exidia glandulosa HHB12029]